MSCPSAVSAAARLNRASGPLALALALLLAGAAAAGTAAAARKPARTAPKDTVAVVQPLRVTAYYFHTTNRCASCRAIEAYSKEAIETAFADELKDGRLVWKLVNVEQKGNEHFVKDYQLYTKALVLVDETRGRAPRWRNLEKVWQLLRDKEAFLRYVRTETRAFLDAPGA